MERDWGPDHSSRWRHARRRADQDRGQARSCCLCGDRAYTAGLQRSGIGPRDVIKAANGTVRVELPGVGFNLQDHMYFPINYTCKSGSSRPFMTMELRLTRVQTN